MSRTIRKARRGESKAQRGGRRRRGRSDERRNSRVLVAWLLGVAIVAVGLLYAVRREAAPVEALGEVDIPQPDLAGVDEEIVASFNQLRAAVERSPDSAAAWGRLGMLLDAHDLWAEAESCYREAASLAPKDFEWRYHLAVVAESRGRALKTCIALLDEAAEIDPGYAPLYLRKAALLSRAGEVGEALAACRRAVALAPESLVGQVRLGQLLLANGDYEASREQLLDAVSMGAEDKAALSALAQAFVRLGDRESATGYARKAADASDGQEVSDPLRSKVKDMALSPTAIYAQAQAFRKSGQYGLAEARFEVVERLLPRDPYAPLFRAFCLMYLGRMSEAHRSFERSEQMGEGLRGSAQAFEVFHASLWEFRVEFLGLATRQGSPDLASRALESVRTAEAADPLSTPAKAYLTWGTTLCRVGRLEEGLKRFEQSVERDPGYAHGYYNIGATLEEMGRAEEAVDAYRKAVELDPTHRARQRLVELGAAD